jgi:uncharacterized protein YpmS
MKWFKRLMILLVVLIIGGVAFVGTSYWLAKRRPTWYRPLALSSNEMDAAAKRALNKVIVLHNIADQAAAVDSSKEWRQSNGATTLPAVNPLTITFTQDELTAFIAQWSRLNSERVERYVTGPQFALEEGQIKFAAHITDLDQVGVLRIEPSVDEKGLLHLEIVSVSAGSLPIPEGMVQKRLAKAEALLLQWLPDWQQKAKVAADGANSQAVKAAMTKLFLGMLHHQPSPAILFMPIDNHRTVPMRLTHVEIGQGTITLTVNPLNEAGRKAALESLRQPMEPITTASN